MTMRDNTRDVYDNPSTGADAGALNEQAANGREVAFTRGLVFQVKNLGAVRAGRFTQKPLTLFCGPNNSGKTWAVYSLYHWHRRLAGLAAAHKAKKPGRVAFNRLVSAGLPAALNVDGQLLDGAQFNLARGRAGEFQQLLAEAKERNVFLVPAERNGLQLVRHPPGARRQYTVREPDASCKPSNDNFRSHCAAPAADYMDWLNQLPETRSCAADDFHRLAGKVKKELVRGAYRLDKSTGGITFKPYRAKRGGEATHPLVLHAAPGAVKSLFGLWFYLERQARPGDLLMIDEPELNIHPENQLKMTRLFARLVNAGLNLVISTHSDYIIREINSLLMLNEDKGGDLRKEYGYAAEEVLRPDQVGAYLVDQQTIASFRIEPIGGIHAGTFDDVIKKLNWDNNGIFYDLYYQRMEEDDGD